MADQTNFDQFDTAVAWSDIPTSDTVEEGRYVLKVREFKLAGSQEGKLMAVGFFMIAEGPLEGVPFPIQNYVCGSEDDLLCRDPQTMKKTFGGRQLNMLLEACGTLKDERSLRTTLRRAEQARFQAYVTQSIQKAGDYAGSSQNRITRYVAYGQEMIVPGKAHVTGSNGQYTVTLGGVIANQPRSRMRPPIPGQPEREEVTIGPEDVGQLPPQVARDVPELDDIPA